MNRFCPDNMTLGEYVSGVISPGKRTIVEEHITGCPRCMELIIEAYESVTRFGIYDTLRNIMDNISSNKWIYVTILLLALSFVFKGYFVQFIATSVLTGVKWIVDSKTVRMLIMINKALKENHMPPGNNPEDRPGIPMRNDRNTTFHKRRQ